MRLLTFTVILLDCLTLLVGLVVGFIVAVGVGMGRVRPLNYGGPMPPSPVGWQSSAPLGLGVGLALLVALPSAFMLWRGFDRTALVLAMVPALSGCVFLWMVRGFFNL